MIDSSIVDQNNPVIFNVPPVQPVTQLRSHLIASIPQDYETTCWGCGLRVLLPSYSPVFKCGWCGAITNDNAERNDSKRFWWRRLRDRGFVCVLLLFMVFVIGGGVWAVYPVLFSISYFCGGLHSIITTILALTTVRSFSLAAFRCAGTPPSILWGSCTFVGKGGLENYTFCNYCSKPKSPIAHHCRSCRMCILDMDHHCPFIGNCVGAANHRSFIIFLISAISSTFYVSMMSIYAGSHLWPSVTYNSPVRVSGMNTETGLRFMKEIIIALLSSSALLSARGLLLVYLFVASVSVQIGLVVLLWQQLCYIYEGKTYLSNLDSEGNADGDRDCQNLTRFFGFTYTSSRYLPTVRRSAKIHKR